MRPSAPIGFVRQRLRGEKEEENNNYQSTHRDMYICYSLDFP